jgi:hypothetical protein
MDMIEIFENMANKANLFELNLSSLQYFTYTSLKKVVEAFNSIPELKKAKVDLKLETESINTSKGTKKVYTLGYYSIRPLTNKTIPDYTNDDKELEYLVFDSETADDMNLADVIKTSKIISKYIIDEYLFGNLRKLREGQLVRLVVNKILEPYEFLKLKDENVLEKELPDIIEVISIIKNKNGNVIISNLNDYTKEILLETLNELGVEYEIIKDKLYSKKRTLVINW